MIRLLLERLVDLFRYLFRFISSFFRDTSDPIGDVLRFINYFERSYGTNHPEFYRGSYTQAVSDAKKELRFLLIYLHSDHHPEAQDFCSNVLIHREVVNYLTRNRILFWASSINSTEGYRVQQLLRENSYPLLALITLVDNQMTVVKKFVGNTSVESLLSRLQKAIEENESSLIAARVEQEERTMNRIIREEQDQAYMESLKADQEKDRKREEERKRKENEEMEKRQKEEDEQMQREKLIKLKYELVDRIPPEPAVLDSDAIRIVLKLPSGTRLERKFKRKDSVMSLYYYVFCHDQSPLKFQITTNFPRKELPGRPPSLEDPLWNKEVTAKSKSDVIPTLDEIGLGKSEVLFVHDLEA